MVSVAAFFDSRVVVSMNEIMFIRTCSYFFSKELKFLLRDF